MPQGALIRPPPRSTPGVAAAVAAWRRLTGGKRVRDSARRTLIACSGGADSSALALALAAATDNLVIAHVIHDMRPATEAGADRDAAAQLAAGLGLDFVQATVRVRTLAGNTEANARRARYRALASLARRCACPFIATAHHADDQLETILMRLVRGAGARGLAGVAERRRAGKGVDIVRPLLGLTRAHTEAICSVSGWAFRRDATNTDSARLRSALRLDVVPRLRAVAPRAAAHAASAAAILAELHDLADQAGIALLRLPHSPNATPDTALAWPRAELRPAHPAALAAGLRRAALLISGGTGADRLNSRAIRGAVRAIGDDETEPRSIRLADAMLVVTARAVELQAAQHSPARGAP